MRRAPTGTLSLRTAPVSQHADFCQGPVQFRWERVFVGAALGKIGWRIGGLKIPPTLERPFGSRLCPVDNRLQHNTAAGDPISAQDLVEPNDPLPAQDKPLENPVERSVIQELLLPFWPHPRDVARQPVRALGARILLPVDQVLNAIRSDAKLHKVDRFIHRVAPRPRVI